ncbi:phage head morphogenesis protein [Salicibibacter halophilus]|uniref:Phage head morphogenesis protein n=1 Tax=Salicibibacter halophilus TaxID=2502791 RepID=A0A514LG42_9BACI|nr:minor capsid protein [Salicibibacter halophilus]QDI90221.1 phage head morphogenesis protein [Salicibibacter halophilus]
MPNSQRYWAEREREQSEMEALRDDEVLEGITQHFEEASDEADKEITRLYSKYASDEGFTLSEAQKTVDQTDIRQFEDKAQEYVAEGNFSDRANAEMRQYNTQMRVSRLQLMQKYADLETARAHGLSEIDVTDRLEEIARSETRRQSGILGMTVSLSSEEMEELVRYQFHGELFSDRIWDNRDILVQNLNTQLRRQITQGAGPRELAQNMRREIGNSVYNTERIMRTETARVQIQTQKRSYEQAGMTHYDIVSETDACEDCAEHDGEIYEVSDMQIGVNAPVFHPNCRCSTAPIIPDE